MAVLINRSVIRTNWLASSHILKMAGQSFGRKKYYGLTVTVSSEVVAPPSSFMAGSPLSGVAGDDEADNN